MLCEFAGAFDICEEASPHLEAVALLCATSTKLTSRFLERLRLPVDYELFKLDCEISCILRVMSHYLILQPGDGQMFIAAREPVETGSASCVNSGQVINNMFRPGNRILWIS